MPVRFHRYGYDTLAVGKLFHNGYSPNPNRTEFQIAGPWDDDPFGPYPSEKIHIPDGLGENNPGYDWGFPYESDEETTDYRYCSWAVEKILETRSEPFFMAVGLTGTHLPHFSAGFYQKQFPIEKVQLPPIFANDLDDVPERGRAINVAPAMPSHEWVTANRQLPEMVQTYLACVAAMDKQVGRLLDALDASGKADSTIVVLTSDNGMHRGEKQQYEKWTLWSRSTRVPLIFSIPGGLKGGLCRHPVELLDIYPTLLDLCGLPPDSGLEGQTLRMQLNDPEARRSRPAITTWYPKNHRITTAQWHYIRYADGSGELYDAVNDPNEWNNLAGSGIGARVIPELAGWLPAHNQPPVPGSDYGAVPSVVRNSEDWIKD